MYMQKYMNIIIHDCTCLYIPSGSFTRPDTGEHTVKVLKDIGYSEQEIRELLDTNTVYQCETRAKL